MHLHTLAFDIYKKHRGRSHRLIEQEIRSLGYPTFSRRSFYDRKKNGRITKGWIERFGWDADIPDSKFQIPDPSDIPDSKFQIPDQPAIQDSKFHIPDLKFEISPRSINPHPTPRSKTQNPQSLMLNPESKIHDPNSPILNPESKTRNPKDPFRHWLKQTFPKMHWDWRHQIAICEQLERIRNGSIKRLMITVPPRHGKSELVTVRFAAFYLLQDPAKNVILGSYAQSLANRFSRKVKRAIAESISVNGQPDYGDAAPADPFPTERTRRENSGHAAAAESAAPARPSQRPVPMFPSARPANTVADWETAAGGGLRAVGVGAGVTGYGADLVIIDDPVKNRAQAESQVFRDRAWDWYNNDIHTRLEPDAPVILIQTRWHEDDLAGRLLRQAENGGEQWEVLSLPALAEEIPNAAPESAGVPGPADAPASGQTQPIVTAISTAAAKAETHGSSDISAAAASEQIQPTVSMSPTEKPITAITRTPIDRLPGEALCPERFTREQLLEKKRQIGSYAFSALYQQRPHPLEGGLFKRKWFDNAVIPKHPDNLRWYRAYDLAVSTKTSADYTASFRCAKDKDGILYIADGYRARIEYPDQRRYVIERMLAEENTVHGIETALHGLAFVQDLRRHPQARNIPLLKIKAETDKFTRALTWSPIAEDGKVRLVRGPWIEDFLEEICRFTGRGDHHDDQVDAVSMAVKLIDRHAQTENHGF